MKVDLKEEIETPEGVEAKYEERFLVVKGPKGEVKKELVNPKIDIKIEGKKIVLEAKKATKREKRMIYTFLSHIKNLVKGVVEGHFYELTICAGHFPMNVSVSGDELIIKNFLGENYPRKMKIKQGVEVKIEGNKIRIESPDLESAGQTAGNIETLTKVKGRDRRIFQDGIFISNKNGKAIK